MLAKTLTPHRYREVSNSTIFCRHREEELKRPSVLIGTQQKPLDCFAMLAKTHTPHRHREVSNTTIVCRHREAQPWRSSVTGRYYIPTTRIVKKSCTN